MCLVRLRIKNISTEKKHTVDIKCCWSLHPHSSNQSELLKLLQKIEESAPKCCPDFFKMLCCLLCLCLHVRLCVCLPSQLFKGKFYYCVGFDVKNITNKSDCLAANYRWVHHKYNFDNLGQVQEKRNILFWAYSLLMYVSPEPENRGRWGPRCRYRRQRWSSTTIFIKITKRQVLQVVRQARGKTRRRPTQAKKSTV